MENIIPELIDTDQTGFGKNRQTQDNVKCTRHVINYMKNINCESIWLSVSMPKSLVRWEYLYLVLQRFGFNNQVVNYFTSLYNSPTARIKVNGNISKTVPLQRGCRQGCPLSPTLLALFIEPLTQAIREDKDISGVQTGGEQHKICAYADDILLTLTDPNRSLSKLLALLKTFGSYSGYKLNLHKTQTLTFNYLPPENIHKMSKFKWKDTVIKYLGVNIPKDLSQIYDHNYPNDLNRWS